MRAGSIHMGQMFCSRERAALRTRALRGLVSSVIREQVRVCHYIAKSVVKDEFMYLYSFFFFCLSSLCATSMVRFVSAYTCYFRLPPFKINNLNFRRTLLTSCARNERANRLNEADFTTAFCQFCINITCEK